MAETKGRRIPVTGAEPQNSELGRSEKVGKSLTRKEREHLRHMGEALVAAEKLLAKRSFSDVTVQDVAAESEFSVGYLYKLFPNKEGIYLALIAEKMSQVRSLVETALAPPGPWDEKLLGLTRALFTWMESTPAFASEYARHLIDFSQTDPATNSHLNEFRLFTIDRLNELFSEPISTGELVEDEPGTILATCRALFEGFIRIHIYDAPKNQHLIRFAPIIVRSITRTFAPEARNQ